METIKASSALTCPLCKHVFHFRKNADSPKHNPALIAKGTTPLASPSGEEPPSLAFEPRPLVRVARRRPARSAWRPSRLLVVLALFATLGSSLFAVFYHFRDELNWDFLDSKTAQEARAFNYRFRLPEPWIRDPETEAAMKASGLKVRLALRRSQPPSRLAILVRDFEKEHTMPDANLLDEVLRGMGRYFQSFEWQRKDEGLLGGTAARRIDFQGDENGFTMRGECLMTTHQGYAYWFVTWAPHAEKDGAAGEWESVRQGFQFLNRREGWTERPRKRIGLSGVNASFLIRYPDGLWEKQTLEGFDSAADAALLGTDPSPSDGAVRHDAKRAATFQILVLPKEEDLKAVIASLEKRLLAKQKEDGFPNSKLESIDEELGGLNRSFEGSGLTGWLKSVRLKNSETRERYVLLAVAIIGDQMLGILGECDWQRRAFWEQEFLDLLHNLERKKGKDTEDKKKDG